MATIMGDDQLVLGALLVVNAALYALLILAVVRGTRRPRTKATNLADAFLALEAALKITMADLPPGFTWAEAVAYLRGRGVEMGVIQNALASYEAYRYGGKPLPNMDYREVLRLTDSLGGVKAGH